MLAAFYAVVLVLGILSMGFQLLGNRLLNPHFGSDIIVWAWLISTFLAAFACGSMLGGEISRLASARRRRAELIVAAVGIAGFAFTAIEAQPNPIFGSRTHPFLSWLELGFADRNAGLFGACVGLFFFPVVALSSFGPLCVQHLAARGTPPGAASGVIYGVSTIGNIAGVMLTALLLIPYFGVSRLLIVWLIVAVLGLGCLLRIFRSGSSSPA
jgi:hypothetical protein